MRARVAPMNERIIHNNVIEIVILFDCNGGSTFYVRLFVMDVV